MAKPMMLSVSFTFFDVLMPDPSADIGVTGGVTPVRVQVTGGGINGFKAQMFDLPSLAPSTNEGVVNLNQEGGTAFYSRSLRVGTPVRPPYPNRRVVVNAQVDGSTIETGNVDFTAFVRGVGSAARSGRVSAMYRAENPVPAALSLELGVDAADKKSRANQSLLLVHVESEGDWLSEPIAKGGAEPSFWVLRQTDARTWSLRLRRGAVDLATYQGTSDSAFPVKFQLTSGSNQPRTAMVHLAG